MIEVSLLGILSTVGAWAGRIILTAIGALLAYAIWSWLHSPHLYLGEVIHKDLLEKGGAGVQRSIRLEIQNIGTRAAVDCEAIVNLRVKTPDGVARSLSELPWLPTKANLVVGDAEQSLRKTIPAGRRCKLELARQYRDRNLQLNVGAEGPKFFLTSEGDEYHRPLNEPVDFAVVSTRSGYRDSDVIQTTAALNPDQVLGSDWENAYLSVLIETKSARPLVINFDISNDSEGNLTVKPEKRALRERLANYLYRAIYWVRQPISG